METDHAAAGLLGLDTAELLAFFATLPAPPIEEMDGEYTARLLAIAALPSAFMAATLAPLPAVIVRACPGFAAFETTTSLETTSKDPLSAPSTVSVFTLRALSVRC